MEAPRNEITQLLARMQANDEAARAELIPIVYRELRRLAGGYMRRERRRHPDHTLQSTALVHEAYLRLVHIHEVSWESRGHFFGVAAHIMRQVLVDHHRKRAGIKHGGHVVKIELDEALVFSPAKSAAVVALDEALDRLARKDARLSQVVELRFFGGLTFEEVAEVMQLSVKTVQRDWQLARAWLHAELGT